jgi:hypothetical protein
METAIDSYKIIDSKKFMWDGCTYETLALAEEARQQYEANDFETRIITEDDKPLVYTRRIVEEVVVDGAPPL